MGAAFVIRSNSLANGVSDTWATRNALRSCAGRMAHRVAWPGAFQVTRENQIWLGPICRASARAPARPTVGEGPGFRCTITSGSPAWFTTPRAAKRGYSLICDRNTAAIVARAAGDGFAALVSVRKLGTVRITPMLAVASRSMKFT